jgi:hypothetical protein
MLNQRCDMKQQTKTTTKSDKKKIQKKVVLASLAAGAIGILGYFGWQYFKKKQQKKGDDVEAVLKTAIHTNPNAEPIINTPPPKHHPTSVPPRKKKPTIHENNDADEKFPLQKGSRGEQVKQLQRALIAKYGKQILPKYGADGDFGGETIAALKKLQLPTSISKSSFHVLVNEEPLQYAAIAEQLYQATDSNNFNTVISVLKKLPNKEAYTQTNQAFKNYRINGVRQTLVNGLLNVFTKPVQKQAIRFEFIRMGLQYDGNKWSLSGIDGLPLITTQATKVWINAQEGVQVPASMVLGNEVSQRLDYTLFENKGKYFLVQTNTVKYI